jgi:hypothetical protein
MAAAGGAAVSGVTVDAMDHLGNPLASATTSVTGTYTLRTSGINAALTPDGAISGRVTAAAGGAPVSGVQVDVMEGDGYQLAATTSAAGFYTVTGLLPASGGDIVCFDATNVTGSATGFVSQCYKGAAWTAGNPPPAGVTRVGVRAATTTRGINAALTALGAISGRVTAAAGGAAVSGVLVDVLYGSGNYLTGGITSAAGTYSVPGLAPAPGGDIVCFDASQAPVSDTGFANQCYRGVIWTAENALPAGVTRVRVGVGTITAGINAALTPGGAISGKVTAAVGGAPVSGVAVDVSDASGDDLASATTSAAGTYSVPGLAPAPGGDIVCFDATDQVGVIGFASQCYKGVAWNTGNPPPAGVTRVKVKAGTTTAGINAALTPGGAISGRVGRHGGTGRKG